MTLAIMAVLISVAVPAAQVVEQRRKEGDLRRSLIEIRQAIDAYKRAADQGRVQTNAGDSGYPPTLDDLVQGVPDLRSQTRQKMYFLRALPKDPMAPSPAASAVAGAWGLRSYASSPDDPQPGADVFDVFSTSSKVGLNGVPYRQW